MWRAQNKLAQNTIVYGFKPSYRCFRPLKRSVKRHLILQAAYVIAPHLTRCVGYTVTRYEHEVSHAKMAWPNSHNKTVPAV